MATTEPIQDRCGSRCESSGRGTVMFSRVFNRIFNRYDPSADPLVRALRAQAASSDDRRVHIDQRTSWEALYRRRGRV
jgi:hypothetical protein